MKAIFLYDKSDLINGTYITALNKLHQLFPQKENRK